MRKLLRLVGFLFVITPANSLILLAQDHPSQSGQPGQMARAMHGPASKELRISFGDKSTVLTPDKLAALPHTTLKVYNGHAKAEGRQTAGRRWGVPACGAG